MRKIIAAINITIDGFCDHTGMIADDELHEHYNTLLKNSETILYGRTTYQLMEGHWPTIVKNPTGNKPTDNFAVILENIEKIVFSRTLSHVNWKNVRLAGQDIKDEVLQLKKSKGGDILVGSRSIIVQLMNLNLIDELQLCVHPVIIGKGLALFDQITERTILKLVKTKSFHSGSLLNYYIPVQSS